MRDAECSDCISLTYKKILTLADLLRSMFCMCLNWLWPLPFCVVGCLLLDSREPFRGSRKSDLGDLGDPRGTKPTPSCHFHFGFADGILGEDMEQLDFFKESHVFVFSFMASGWISYVIKRTFPTPRL